MARKFSRREFLKRSALAGAAFALQPWRTTLAAVEARTPSIKFCGAAGFVSGSQHLLDTGKYRVLLDCGSFMEPENDQYNGKFVFEPASIDLMILSHAHADHVGNVHQLIRKGFRGRIVTTDATRDIVETVASSMIELGRGDGRTPTRSELDAVLKAFLPVPYNTKARLADDLVLRYTDAGHMLGSAFVELWFGDTKLVFTGDMGPHNAPVLCEPAILRRADYVMIESTYGGVTRPKEDWTRLGTIINETVERGGSVLIPVFAAEKLQRLIYRIGQLKSSGVLPADLKVLSDSTSGNQITEIYRRYSDYYDTAAKAAKKPFNFPGLYEVSGRESLATHGQRGIVYLTTSAMFDYANSPRHLAAMCGDPRNTLIFVGYQSPHTPGGKMYAGDRSVTIKTTDRDGNQTSQQLVIRMRVEKMSGFSGHADGAQLVNWMSNFGRLKQAMVVHGEKSRAEQQARAITERYGFPALAPKLYQTVMLDKTDYVKRITDAPVSSGYELTQSYDRQDY
jgi:metallo-beta-lactamase family protein